MHPCGPPASNALLLLPLLLIQALLASADLLVELASREVLPSLTADSAGLSDAGRGIDVPD